MKKRHILFSYKNIHSQKIKLLPPHKIEYCLLGSKFSMPQIALAAQYCGCYWFLKKLKIKFMNKLAPKILCKISQRPNLDNNNCVYNTILHSCGVFRMKGIPFHAKKNRNLSLLLLSYLQIGAYCFQFENILRFTKKTSTI